MPLGTQRFCIWLTSLFISQHSPNTPTSADAQNPHSIFSKITRKLSSLLLTLFHKGQSGKLATPRHHSLTRLKTRASFLKSEHKTAPKRPQPPVILLMCWCFPCLTLPSILITSADFSCWLSPSSHSQQVSKIDHTLDDLRQLSLANTLHKGDKIIKDDLYALEIHLK